MRQIFLLSILALSGCAYGSSQMLAGTEPKVYEGENCAVEVYRSRVLAVEAGMTEEICRVSGSTAYSFNHTLEYAIERHAPKVCECGVSRAYIENQKGLGLELPRVSLVGFR